MNTPFYEEPILNSPYSEPRQHHALDPKGQPLNEPPRQGRRRSEYITPIPGARKQRAASQQGDLGLGEQDEEDKYNPTPIINEIRQHLASWRAAPPAAWGVTPATARLLRHWREHPFQGVRPFFCQIEAVETIIWLTEVAKPRKQYAAIWKHIGDANAEHNPGLIRLAMKMATGAGKTTVMAMLMAWQTVNAVRSPGSNAFSRGFLVIAPGITIKDRLRILLPNDVENYYRTRELVPLDMIDEMGKAKIVITNYHAFGLREQLKVGKVSKSLMQGPYEKPIKTLETEGQMIQRVANELMGLKNIVVINDEAHHCYRQKPDNEDLETLKGDDRKEAEKENESARMWISGIEAFQRTLGVRAVYDLSATPFFLRGSGYREGTLFPWTVSDFSLIDAIECGIVKLPRVPVADNLIGEHELPIFRNLWEHVRNGMPKKGRGKDHLDPTSLPPELQSGLKAMYNDYVQKDRVWRQAGIEVPPVFIVVCNNTASSKLVYEWISGWQRPVAEGAEELKTISIGNLLLFSNFNEHGDPLARPNTLLIDSKQLESGDALDEDFRRAAAPEIEQFKREIAHRSGAGATQKDFSDAELLREVMNTVGKKDRLGEKIRCVVSVGMLTEGWDTNTVTHIVGVRAFGTQLLCEQVVGRGLRRYSYETNERGLFDVEYADIIGIPFNFTDKQKVAPINTPPKKLTRVAAVKERQTLEIIFPRVTGYRRALPETGLKAHFTKESEFPLTPEMLQSPTETLMEAVVGQPNTLKDNNAADSTDRRLGTIVMQLSFKVLETYYRDGDGNIRTNLYHDISTIVRRWIDEGYVVRKANMDYPHLLRPHIAAQAADRIHLAIEEANTQPETVLAVLDPYNPRGSTRHVGFMTSKDLYVTDPAKCHISHVVCDSGWEAEFARAAEAHPQVISYVKNQGLGFEVPYRDGMTPRVYLPDFIVRIDDGRGADDPLNLVVEVKGYRGENVKNKSLTMRTQWIRGVNALGTFGRWDFIEFTDVYEMQAEFAKLIDRAVAESADTSSARHPGQVSVASADPGTSAHVHRQVLHTTDSGASGTDGWSS